MDLFSGYIDASRFTPTVLHTLGLVLNFFFPLKFRCLLSLQYLGFGFLILWIGVIEPGVSEVGVVGVLFFRSRVLGDLWIALWLRRLLCYFQVSYFLLRFVLVVYNTTHIIINVCTYTLAS